MGDKSPKDKNKKSAQKTAADDRQKGAKKKRQDAYDHTPKKPQ